MTPQSQPKAAVSTQEKIAPVHLGIILDGNRRWAKERGLPGFEGHRAGWENAKKIGDAALTRGVKYLTYFVFSTENWKRSKDEVNYLMNLFFWVATHELDELKQKNIRLRVLGEKSGLTPKLIKVLDKAEAETTNNTGGTLALCLNYGGEQEIASAVAKLIKEGVSAEEVTPEKIAQNLYAPDMPACDLIIRTSGEQRISGFMLYRAAYAEFLFVDKHWPDFSEADLDAALADYASRSRRFGK